MKHILSLFCLLFAASVFAETLHWSDALNDLKRWQFMPTVRHANHGKSDWSSAYCFTFPLKGNEPGVEYEMTRKENHKDELYGEIRFNLHDEESLKGAKAISFDGKISLDQGAKAQKVLVFAGDKKYAVNLPADGEFHPVTVKLDGLDGEKCRFLRFYIRTTGNKTQLALKNMKIDVEAAAAPPFKYPVAVDLAIRAKAPGTVFYVGEPLEFTAVIPEASAYAVSDVYGRLWQFGMLKPGKNILPALPTGYYFLSLADKKKYINNRSFAITGERITLPPGKDCNYTFGGDFEFACPLPEIPTYPGSRGFELADIASRMGLFTLRSIYFWFGPEDYYYNETKKRFQELMAQKGVPVSHMIAPGPILKQVVGDLRFLYNKVNKETAAEQSKNWKYLEFWNEPESFGMPNVWQLTAIAKTAYLAAKKANPALQVQTPSLFRGPILAEMLKSGFVDYFDVHNIHCYDAQSTWAEYIKAHLDVMNAAGIGNRPLHITEIGANNEGAGKKMSYRKGHRAHSLQQEISVAAFLPKSQIMMQAYGVDLAYNFCFAAYSEHHGLKVWGTLRYDNSAKINYIAFANLAKTLGHAEYLGTYDFAPGCAGYLFRTPDGKQTLAFWSDDSKASALVPSLTVKIPQGKGKYTLKDNFGFTSEISSVDGFVTVPVTYSPAYLVGLSGLKVAKPAMVKTGSYKTPANRDTTIVLYPLHGDGFQVEPKKNYLLPQKETGKIKLEIYNFDTVKKSGKLSYKGAAVKDDPGTFEIEPMGKKVIELNVSPVFPKDDYRTDFVINGVFNGKEISPACINIRDLKRIRYKAKMLDYTKLNRWYLACNGKTIAKLNKNDKKVIDFTFYPDSYKGNVAWCSPGYILQKGESFKGAIGVQFDVKMTPAAAKNYWYSILFFGKTNGKRDKLSSPYKKHSEWQTVTVFFMDRLQDLDLIKDLQIDIESKRFQKTEYSLRNIKILYPEK